MTTTPTTTQLLDLADGLSRFVGRLTRVLRQHDSGDLTASQLSMLATIGKFPASRIGEIAAHEGISTPVASRLLASLETHGFVERAADEQDARARHVRLSDDGAEALARLRRARSAVLLQRLALLSDTDRAALASALPLLERLADA